MTPDQYYFPYLFDIISFNKKLEPYGLFSFSHYDDKTQMPDELLIMKHDEKDALLKIPFGRTLMIKDDLLFHWETDTNMVDIVQVSLKNLGHDPWILNAKLDLSELYTGINPFSTYLDIDHFVTYARKDSIAYQQDAYEKFAIVLIQNKQVNIIPFDWFNKSHSEFDYVWPATAKFDPLSSKLYGQGIRMPEFCIEIDKDSL